jgi:hypothetical protein
MFYFEVFWVLLGGLYVLLWRRARLKQWVLSLLLLGVNLIPWGYQAALLATSGYKGSAGGVIVPNLWQVWLPTLIMGETVPALFNFWPLLLVVLAAGLWVSRQRAGLILLWLCLPLLLVTLVSTRMNVFLPRYVIAVLPALLLPIAALFATIWKSRLGKLAVVLFAIGGIGIPLQSYWAGDYHKAPDWFALRDYLTAHAKPGDTILLNTSDLTLANADPAFDYYYHNPATPLVVLPNTATAVTLDTLAIKSGSIWFVPSGDFAGEVDQGLRQRLSVISDRGVGRGWIVREFRPKAVWQGEITHPLTASIADAHLLGFNLDQSDTQLTVLLYWDKPPTFTISVQLIGAPNPQNNGSPLWSQDDHPATVLRDVYTLPLHALPAGTYRLQIVAYDPANPAQRYQWETGTDNLFLTDIHKVLTPNG